MSKALAFLLSAFTQHVLHVVFLCAQKQMAHTRLHVARMKDKQPVRNVAVQDNPRDAMSQLPLATNGEGSISIGVALASPQPTRASLIDVFPKAIRQWLLLVGSRAVRTTVRTEDATIALKCDREWLGTPAADSRLWHVSFSQMGSGV